MADMVNKFSWQGRRVLLTGHTGFKGGWLTGWLNLEGAQVFGLALDPPTSPNIFDIAGIGDFLSGDYRADIRNADEVTAVFEVVQPEVVFHLAAQPLVNYAYDNPLETYATNVMGTANVLEAVRNCPTVRAVVVVTTDKCYENLEWDYPYREVDRLGGYDPYSSSKACTELLVAAWRRSYFCAEKNDVRMATARAGNVIGGGDWAAQRLIPDCVGAFMAGNPVSLRYPNAVRPWQHVLDPISGYVRLAEHLLQENGETFSLAWNFGPSGSDARTVGEVVQMVAQSLPIKVEMPESPPVNHEAGQLRLDSSFALARLGWRACWNIDRAVSETISWYSKWLACGDMQSFTLAQIERFMEEVKK